LHTGIKLTIQNLIILCNILLISTEINIAIGAVVYIRCEFENSAQKSNLHSCIVESGKNTYNNPKSTSNHMV